VPRIQIPDGKVPLDYVMYLRKVSNRQLSQQTEIHETDISRMRRGMRPAKAEQQQKVAKALKVSLADLGWKQEPANA
jgi:DNA-binding Xre family transcriptional regulator